MPLGYSALRESGQTAATKSSAFFMYPDKYFFTKLRAETTNKAGYRKNLEMMESSRKRDNSQL